MATTQSCSACGDDHRVLTSLPNRYITLDELSALSNNESVLYTGPTVFEVHSDVDDPATPVAVIQTKQRTQIVSYFSDENEWRVTFTDETPDKSPEEFGAYINELASQVAEAGYLCVQKWLDDGEPGGNPPA